MRERLVEAGVGEPTLGELVGLGLPESAVDALVTTWRRSGKGVGALVQAIRLEPEREALRRRREAAKRETLSEARRDASDREAEARAAQERRSLARAVVADLTATEEGKRVIRLAHVGVMSHVTQAQRRLWRHADPAADVILRGQILAAVERFAAGAFPSETARPVRRAVQKICRASLKRGASDAYASEGEPGTGAGGEAPGVAAHGQCNT